MPAEAQKRLRYLRNKMWHNNCSNPTCTGYVGTDEELECPKCGNKLFKTLSNEKPK